MINTWNFLAIFKSNENSLFVWIFVIMLNVIHD